MSQVTVAQVRQFLKERLPSIIDVDVEHVKKNGGEVDPCDIKFEQIVDLHKAYENMQEFIKELLVLIKLKPVILVPHDVVGYKSSGKRGRPKQKIDKKEQIKRMEKDLREEGENDFLSSLIEGMKEEEEEPEIDVNTVSFTDKIETCYSCTFSGQLMIVNGQKVCPKCDTILS